VAVVDVVFVHARIGREFGHGGGQFLLGLAQSAAALARMPSASFFMRSSMLAWSPLRTDWAASFMALVASSAPSRPTRAPASATSVRRLRYSSARARCF
jgi:hypothetical protein